MSYVVLWCGVVVDSHILLAIIIVSVALLGWWCLALGLWRLLSTCNRVVLGLLSWRLVAWLLVLGSLLGLWLAVWAVLGLGHRVISLVLWPDLSSVRWSWLVEVVCLLWRRLQKVVARWDSNGDTSESPAVM